MAQRVATNGSSGPAVLAGLPQFRSYSALQSVRAEPAWLWSGFVADGQVTMLAGDAFSGKSTLVGGLLGAMADGQVFLGRQTASATAVLLTEEGDSTLRERSAAFGLLHRPGSWLGRSCGVLGPDWPDLVAHATRHAIDKGHRLLVVDTFPGLAQLQHEHENDAGAITERLRPLQQAAGQGLGVLFLHHTNKQGGIRGSQAFRGVVDISVHFTRHGADVRLRTESRYGGGDPGQLTARLNKAGDGWFYNTGNAIPHDRTVGQRNTVGITRQLLLDAVEAAGENGLTYLDLDRLPGLSHDKGKQHLPAMLEAGLVTHKGAGKKGSPYRWFAAKQQRRPRAVHHVKGV